MKKIKNIRIAEVIMKKVKKNIEIIILSFMIFLSSIIVPSISIAEVAMLGDNASLSGYVLDEETKETLIGATISIVGTKFGAYTNKSGYFSITNILPGEYTVKVSSVGYKKIEKKLKFKKYETIRETFTLKNDAVLSKEVTVEADKEVEKRQISISKIDVPVSQIKEVRVGGESDLFRAIQMLPGVLTSSQISSGLYVRGGSPDQNLVLLDGSAVYNPSHIFGFISTFNSDAIKDVELIKGGFPAEFGGRLSSVLNITQKDGNQERMQGNFALGAISSRFSMEGPIGNGSWFVSGRRTYFDLIEKIIPEDPVNPLPTFWFYDINAKINQKLSDNDKLFFSCFASKDNFEFNNSGAKGDLGIKNQMAATRWTHIFGDNLFSTLNFSATQYDNRFDLNLSGYKFLINNGITDYTLKGSLEWFISDKLTNTLGFESTIYEFKYLQNFTGNTDSTKSGSSGGSLNLKMQDANNSMFSQLNYQLSEVLSIQAGLRAAYWRLCDRLTVDPRLALRWQYNENIAIKAAYGMYHQNLRLSSMQDFSFFDTWLPTDKSVPVSEAQHFILSLETKPADGITLNFDTYYKIMNNVNEIKMTSMEGNKVADVFFIGNARAYGFEVFLQQRIGNLTGWVGYGLGFITSKFDSINNGNEFRPKYDRRHDLKFVLSYKLSDNWDLGSSFTFQTGQSYTGASSRVQDFIPGQTYGRGIIIASQRYGLRLPASHQLNVNVGYSFKSFGLPSKLVLDVYNAYNHKDILMRYYNMSGNDTKLEDVKLIPIIPSISYEISF
jgi:outer membrane cobalamin receptor